MSVFKRKNKYGTTKEYHYKFMKSAKWYYGVCEGCTTERAAVAYEKRIKETAIKLAEQKSVGALIENFKRELTGGDKIKLNQAFTLYMSKPRKKQPSEKQRSINESQWKDFIAFINSKYPEIKQLDKVSKKHAESYIQQLRENGRFASKVNYERIYNGKKVNHSYKTLSKLSGRTVNAFHKTLKSVFSKLKDDAGIISNPFDFEMMDNESHSRDAFTPTELQLIGDNLNDFVKPIFIIGICTGLSEADICLLRWNEIVDMKWIMRKRIKTGSNLEIPILPPLARFLEEQWAISEEDEFVLPEHAQMHKNNPSGISYRVKSFLEGLGIKTTQKSNKRQRASSIKDVHSLRHTFAYMAGCYQIPLPVVQSVLGHMSPEMTKHYQAHADRLAKEKYLAQMPNFLEASEPIALGNPNNNIRNNLKTLLNQLSDNDIKKVFEFVNSLHSK